MDPCGGHMSLALCEAGIVGSLECEADTGEDIALRKLNPSR